MLAELLCALALPWHTVPMHSSPTAIVITDTTTFSTVLVEYVPAREAVARKRALRALLSDRFALMTLDGRDAASFVAA